MSEVNLNPPPVQPKAPEAPRADSASEMKNIRKMRMEREVMVDPSKASKLVKLESTPTYNASGKLIQSAGKL